MSETILKHSRMPRKAKPGTKLAKRATGLSTNATAYLTGKDPKVILQRYLSDEKTVDIAADYGITRQALGQYLLRHAEEDWKEAQVARAIGRKEAAEDALEDATDALQLAKARELLRAAQWDLERVCKRIYGQDVNVTVTHIDLGDRLRRARQRTFEGEVGQGISGSPSLSHAPARDQAGASSLEPVDGDSVVSAPHSA